MPFESRHGALAILDMRSSPTDLKIDPNSAICEKYQSIFNIMATCATFQHPFLSKKTNQTTSSSTTSAAASSSFSTTPNSKAVDVAASQSIIKQQQQQNASASSASSCSFPLYEKVPEPNSADWLACHNTKTQTFSSFVNAKHRAHPTPEKSTIVIVALGKIPHLDKVEKYVSTFFQTKTKTIFVDLENDEKIQKEFGETLLVHREHDCGKQYYAPKLITLCQQMVKKDSKLAQETICTIGITVADITKNDDWNFLYGLSSMTSKKTGVFSLARFSPSFNHEKLIPPAKSEAERAERENFTVFERCLKVATHELMHNFSLKHCINHRCLIAGVNHDRELANQPLLECCCCTKKLLCSFGKLWNLEKRYLELSQLCLEFSKMLLCSSNNNSNIHLDDENHTSAKFLIEAARWKSCFDLCMSVLGSNDKISTSSTAVASAAAAASSSSSSSSSITNPKTTSNKNNNNNNNNSTTRKTTTATTSTSTHTSSTSRVKSKDPTSRSSSSSQSKPLWRG